MNILITGATGFIGTNLLEALKKTNHNIYCISRKKNTNSDRLTWIKTNLENTNFEFLKKIKIDFVFFLAGQTSIINAKLYPEQNYRINSLSLIKLINYFKNINQTPFILYTSTMSVYGLNNENNKINPITLYDVSKVSSEFYLNEYIRQKIISGCIFRLSNIIGCYSRKQKKDRGIISKMIKKIINQESIDIWGDGKYFRDYLHIDDLIHLFLITLKKYKKMNGYIFDVGSGKSITIRDAFKKLLTISKKYFNTTSKINFIPFPDDSELIEKRSTFINIELLKKITGWKKKYNFEDSIIKIIEKELKNERK